MSYIYAAEDGRRELLEANPPNPPEGYIGMAVFPSAIVREKGGQFSYQTVPDDIAVQTNRTRGAAINRTFITMADFDFVTKSVISRASIDWRDVKQYKSKEASEDAGGRLAHRAAYRELEDNQATALFTGSPEAIGSDIFTDIEEGLESIKRYSGLTAMVMSKAGWNALISRAEVIAKLGFSGWMGPTTEAVLSVQLPVVRTMFQTYYGIDRFLIGDNDHWATVDGRVALVKVAPPEDDSHKEYPVYGRTIVYLPDDATNENPIRIVSHGNYDIEANDYTAEMLYQVAPFTENAAAKYLLSGLGATGT